MEASTARRRSVRRKAATTLTEIPDHLLAEIFLRLPAAEDLARASAVCVSFRRLVKDKSFLRGFRRLHRRAATVLHSSTPMATSTARRRHGRKKTKTTLTEIPDHLLSEILLRLPAAGDLARVSAACVTFRRLVIDTDGSFLRRFRRLHDPLLLAFFDRDGFHHAVPPHPSALASAADFSFSFFPNHGDWAVQDIRDGRVLLLRPGEGQQRRVSMEVLHADEGQQRQVSMELAVCDPLHRRYVLLPPVPDDLVASVAHAATDYRPCYEAFLAPLEEEADTAFSVIWMVHFSTRLAALVFSSITGQWQVAASKEWRDLFLGQGKSTMVSPIDREYHERHYAYGCFYWESTTSQKKGLLVLDTRTMEFSLSDLPPREWCTLGLAIVEGKQR
ncbi:uncharacterized protein [Lolium perenne]|uniref:uncharacterized protein n=1 Tax=Lolium perenne TaxID=4522 RepID=UPI0021F55F05|nr:uncharacterized protein LOC127323601 [Lolium perenne]